MPRKQKTQKNHLARNPVRSLRVSDKHWREWGMAAQKAGIDRNKFIVAICNNAAFQILSRQDDEEEEEQDE